MGSPTLPIGVQSFCKLRKAGLRYVDKTNFAAELVNGGYSYFLSRPRRFGKSLFVSMLKELFEGNEELFHGLAIHKNWDWSQRYPVIHLDFGAGSYLGEGRLEQRASELIGSIERNNSLPAKSNSAEGRFSDLIDGLSDKTGAPVVVLVDEYDKPILSTLGEPEIAVKNRDMLQGFYTVLKARDANIRFCFVTGVSLFSHASLFSGANNLTDISLDSRYSDICGYTEEDIDEVFSEEVAKIDRQKMREWYNGYSWLGENRMYNPLGILRTLETGEFKAWWYRTSTPTFLFETMKRRGVLPTALEDMSTSDGELNAAEIDDVSTAALLFQTGYLTIVDHMTDGDYTKYILGYPNREVRQSFNESILGSILSSIQGKLSDYKFDLRTQLRRGDFDSIEETLESVFAGIPYQWHVKSKAASYEAYFASVVYAFFIGSQLDVRVEDSTSEGRIDLTVVGDSHVYIFEFKVVNGKPLGTALEQLKEKNYAKKYKRYGKPIHLVGIEFSRESKNVEIFRPETA